VATGEQKAQFAEIKAAVYAVAFTPDGHDLLTTSDNGKLRTWAITSKQLLHTFTEPILATCLAVSPDGQWLYVVSAAKSHTTAFGPSEGLVSVLSVQKLETSPGSALVSQATVGCGPAGVAASADGKMVWVTARGSNDLLGFSAARLRTDPGHALTALVRVGQTPTGVVLADGGKRIIVADTNLAGSPGADNLAVVSVPAALARKPALTGYIPSGRAPLSLALPASGTYLYVADSRAARIQVVNLSTLPAQRHG